MSMFRFLAVSAALAAGLALAAPAASAQTRNHGYGDNGSDGLCAMRHSREISDQRLRAPSLSRGAASKDSPWVWTKADFRAQDSDGDKQLSLAEFATWHAGLYDRIDFDGNGLSLEEYHAARLGGAPGSPDRPSRKRDEAFVRSAERYSQMDTDGDRVVTREEFDLFGAAELAATDANGDGRMSWKEVKAFNRSV